MAEQKPNLICKYSGCHFGKDGSKKEYYACAECIRVKPWKIVGCCVEHGFAYQNEVAIARGENMPFPELKDMMVKDGVIKEAKTSIKNSKIKSDVKSEDVK